MSTHQTSQEIRPDDRHTVGCLNSFASFCAATGIVGAVVFFALAFLSMNVNEVDDAYLQARIGVRCCFLVIAWALIRGLILVHNVMVDILAVLTSDAPNEP